MVNAGCVRNRHTLQAAPCRGETTSTIGHRLRPEILLLDRGAFPNPGSPGFGILTATVLRGKHRYRKAVGLQTAGLEKLRLMRRRKPLAPSSGDHCSRAKGSSRGSSSIPSKRSHLGPEVTFDGSDLRPPCQPDPSIVTLQLVARLSGICQQGQ
jgi:hypothetical protein